jgi:hypothetical protein
VHSVDAPVAVLTTVSAVPNGSVGLAQSPVGAAEYHVASPTSLFDVARGAAVVVVVGGNVVVVGGAVVVGGGSGGTVVVVTATGTVVVDAGGAVEVVVVVTGGAAVVLVVDAGAENATRCDGRSTLSRCDGGYTTIAWASWR